MSAELMDRLGALCERLDRLLTALERLYPWTPEPAAPTPRDGTDDAPQPPYVVAVYGVAPPSSGWGTTKVRP